MFLSICQTAYGVTYTMRVENTTREALVAVDGTLTYVEQHGNRMPTRYTGDTVAARVAKLKGDMMQAAMGFVL